MTFLVRSFVILAVTALCACGTIISEPAAVRMTTGMLLVGTATASLSEGKFHVATGDDKISCSGTYDPLDTSTAITAPVSCSDGRIGTISLTRTSDGLAGSGVVTMANGDKGAVAFGRLASTVISSSSSEVAAPDMSGVSTSAACVSENSLGSTSCETGQPKTSYVNGYTRSNGTYVSGYYRSHK